MIELINLTKNYFFGSSSQRVLNEINLHIGNNELVAIMGPSGSGKSTLMNILGLLDRQSSGNYFLNDTDVEKLNEKNRAKLRNEKIGFVFQQFFLLPRLSALENVALTLNYRGLTSQAAKEQAFNTLTRLHMQDYIQHYPSQLSGGQQQRVALARALVGEPDIVLADEPTGSLDSKTGQEVMDLFIQLHRENRRTIIIVTHDPIISQQCDRIIHLSDGKVTSIQE